MRKWNTNYPPQISANPYSTKFWWTGHIGINPIGCILWI